MVAIVDNDDYQLLSKHKWTAHVMNGVSYAVRRTKVNGKFTNISMHRVIMNADESVIIDHKNRDGLDNRRANLRIATKSQNAINSKNRIGTSSKYRGVTYDKINDKWKAYIRVKGKQKTIGRFDSEKEAALARDFSARNHHGEFAKFNF